MGTLLGLRHGIGGKDSDPPGDGDIAPLLRWALRETVSDQAPGDTVWQSVQGRVTARAFHHTQRARHLTTGISALAVAVLVLTMGMMYGADEEQLQVVAVIVQPTDTVETQVADPALPIVAAASIIRVLPLPHPDVDATGESTSVPMIEKPRVVQPVDTQDDALKPIHKLRLTLVAPVSIQPGSIVSVVIRGEPPKPIE